MKEKLFFILIILLLSLNVHAVVIEDLNNTITSQTQALAKSNAELNAKISRLETQLNDLETQLTTLNNEVIKRNDLDGVYTNISILNRQSNAQNLATMLAVILFAFALLFLFKSKAWL